MDLIIQDLCKAYYGQAVLQDFSYCFPEGKTTCIMGRSGCGKTTLLNLILGLELPDTGTIQGNKEPMAAVFQENRLCRNLTVQANIRLVNKRLSEERLRSFRPFSDSTKEYIGIGIEVAFRDKILRQYVMCI